MRDDPQVTDLVIRASRGDRQAWDALVERYAPLIWAICRRYRLVGTDAEDVSQAVWLTMVERSATSATRPRFPAGSSPPPDANAAGSSALRQLAGGGQVLENLPDAQAIMAEKELLTAERHAALREAFARLPSASQQLLALLIADPPLPYAGDQRPGWASRSAASGPTAAAAWTSCAATRPSPA